MSKEHVVEILTLEQLQDVLLHAQVNYMLWESGRKNETHLLKEIRDGETELVNDPEYGLVRQTQVLNIQVKYIDNNGNEFILIEDRQEWHERTDEHGNKRIDRRGYRHISEKITSTEILAEGAIAPSAISRALSEELDGVSVYTNLSYLSSEVQFQDSPSFPGLKTKYIIHEYTVTLPESEYRDEYKEVGKEKTTYFTWQET